MRTTIPVRNFTILTIIGIFIAGIVIDANGGLFRRRRFSNHCNNVVAAVIVQPSISTAITTTTVQTIDQPVATTITTTQVSPIISTTIPAVATVSQQQILTPAIAYPYGFANTLGGYAQITNSFGSPYVQPYGQYSYQRPITQTQPATTTQPTVQPSTSAKDKLDPELVKALAAAILDELQRRQSKTSVDEPNTGAPKPVVPTGAVLLSKNCAACHTQNSPKLAEDAPVLFTADKKFNKALPDKKIDKIIEAIHEGRMPPKSKINPATGKAFKPVKQDEYWQIKTWLESVKATRNK